VIVLYNESFMTSTVCRKNLSASIMCMCHNIDIRLLVLVAACWCNEA